MSDREILPPCGTYQYYIKHFFQERLWQVLHRNNNLTTDKALLQVNIYNCRAHHSSMQYIIVQSSARVPLEND